MCKVVCSQPAAEGGFVFFSGSLEDCVQVALNLHSVSNVPHKICVFTDTDSGVLTLIVKENGQA